MLTNLQITIAPDQWERAGSDADPTARLLSHMNINGLDLHVEAIAVAAGEAADEEFAIDLEIYETLHDTRFSTVEIDGRDYIIVCTPFGCSGVDDEEADEETQEEVMA